MSSIKAPKKLIEVALPLDEINAAAAYEKMPGIGAHPRGIHHWWARRPMAAARAFIFAQLINDPGYERSLGRGVNKIDAQIERERIFDIIRDLSKWENRDNELVLERARNEILKSWVETCSLNKNHPQASVLFDVNKIPAFHDPFAGGGALPLEAHRLGMESYATDLNPVAVLINKAMIEFPCKFVNVKPVGPETSNIKQKKLIENWSKYQGIAEDVRRYGNLLLTEAKKSIGHVYPKIKITKEMALDRPDLKQLIGEELKIVAWLWARTVNSPNPAFNNIKVPLISSFKLSNKKGKEAWIEPIIDSNSMGYQFKVRVGGSPIIVETVNRKGAICLLSNTPIDFKYIRSEGKAGRIGSKLMAVVAEGSRSKVYLSPTKEMEDFADVEIPIECPDIPLPEKALGFRIQEYGLTNHKHLYTNRQLLALCTLIRLVKSLHGEITNDAIKHGLPDDGKGINDGGCGATAYADTVTLYLSFIIDRLVSFNNSVTGWRAGNEKIMNVFSRSAIPMAWDYGEANILENVVGGLPSSIDYVASCIETLPAGTAGHSSMMNAMTNNISINKVISTDPPYYDNIGYSDLSDMFYVWLRKCIKDIFPQIFSTVVVPKTDELIATPFRHDSKVAAEMFFMDGMTKAMHNLAEQAHPAFPVTIYYAFKQSDTVNNATSSTGWETFLEAVIKAGFAITGTWPIRSEQEIRIRGRASNALASSIILVCRKRDIDSTSVSRREFQRELKETMPDALEDMIGGKGGMSPIAPVDLAQASIGPGMAVFSKYSSVLEADGSSMTVHTALTLINKEIDDYFGGQSFDEDSNFCLAWFDEYGWTAGLFGQADVLARAKGTSVEGVDEAGVIESGAGKVRLYKFTEYPADWSPEKDNRTPVWEALHHLVRAIQSGGESATGALLARMPERGESIRQLAYRLYTLCERKGWAEDARGYNELITSWHEIEKASHETGHIGAQMDLGV